MQVAGLLPVLLLHVFLPIYVNCGFMDSVKNMWNKVYTYQWINFPFSEGCNKHYINEDISVLDEMLERELYGQQIAHHTIINALEGHLKAKDPPKALSMSFHGTPGTGKNYVAQMIAKSIFRKGTDSKFYHYFNGRSDFPFDEQVEVYQEMLRKTIEDSLAKCERSVFVFDEVDKTPQGLLNVLVPFLDYNTWHKSWRYSTDDTVLKQKAIYIFLSNTGAKQIVKHMISLWSEGKKQRHETKIQDFERLIALGAFNEKGGFHHSDTIETNLIDHYVPFLPLEEEHVERCIRKAFEQREVMPTRDMINEVMSHVTFGPPPYNLYSTAGCKRLEQKVASIIYSFKRRKSPDL